jgi:hypothetical protein
LSATKYLSVDSSDGPEIMRGVRASSIRILSTSSTIAVVQLSLYLFFEVYPHVIPQVIKTKFIICAVCDIGSISRLLIFIALVAL